MIVQPLETASSRVHTGLRACRRLQSSVDARLHVPRVVVVVAADWRRVTGQPRSGRVTHDGASHVTSDDVIANCVIVRVASEPVISNIELSTCIRIQSERRVSELGTTLWRDRNAHTTANITTSFESLMLFQAYVNVV